MIVQLPVRFADEPAGLPVFGIHANDGLEPGNPILQIAASHGSRRGIQMRRFQLR